MKKIYLLSVSLTFLHANTLSLVNYDPFYKSQRILHSTPSKPKNKSLVLNAVFNNKAFINGKFYTVGDKILGYKIKKIYTQSVVIQNRKILKILRLQAKQHQLIITQPKREKE
ncbi:hypothetical protein [Sulfurimonas sp.]